MKKFFLLSVLVFFFYCCKVPAHLQPNTVIKKYEKEQIPYYSLQHDSDLDILINEVGNRRIVLLGEASHGTSEYYVWRAAISKRLIKEKGFDFIAVEGDWTDCYKVNQFIKGEKKDSTGIITLLKEYNRWPTWLWANYEVASFVGWLNAYNQNLSMNDKVGFYGLDVFNVAEAADEILPYLKPSDTGAVNAVKTFQQCFKSFADDEQQYIKISSRTNFSCKAQANRVLQAITQIIPTVSPSNEMDFALLQNALVVYDGEMYLRTASNRIQSWNLRDNHMAETINRLLKLYGPNSKAIIWAHNNHVGDARYGTMHWTGKTNLGEILRNKYGSKNVFITGFGSYSGSLIAAEKWGNPYSVMQTPPADDSSWEEKLHHVGAGNKIVLSRQLRQIPFLMKWLSHVGIGVVYRSLDKYGIYSIAQIPNRYDAFIYFDHTNALHPVSDPDKSKRVNTGILDY